MADKPKADFDLEKLLRELRAEETTEGWAVEELCEKAGWPLYESYKRKIRAMIRRGIKVDGTWERTGERWFEDYTIDGHGKWVPAYRPTSKEK